MKRDDKYKVALVAYKDVPEGVKDITYKHSVCNIDNLDDFQDMLVNQTNYGSQGRNFNLNDRVGIYFGWFKEDILNNLRDKYRIGIVEYHKSYLATDYSELERAAEKYSSNFKILDTESI